MIKFSSVRSTALVGLLALTGVVLQACASTPPPAAPIVKAAKTPPKGSVPRNDGKMAPIPNPPETAKPTSPPAAVPMRPTVKPAAPKPAPAKPAAPAEAAAAPTDPAKAAKLRAAGLEQLNRGAIDKAVALLQQALALDPGNALIQRDLDRALRISQAVHAKP